MTAFPGPELERPRTKDDVAPRPEALDVFARIEGLSGEEERLLAIPAAERSRAERDRLHAIAGELDRIWEHLRKRAARLGHRPGSDPQFP
ncbi:MAG: hypothetical protein JWN32_2101 [Solirubrobacterales bacterium]|nr:hypothetical protein [Solirubrobacterales bacterium]